MENVRVLWGKGGSDGCRDFFLCVCRITFHRG